MEVNNFYENVKTIDYKKMSFLNIYGMSDNFAKINPNFSNPYYQKCEENRLAFQYALNAFVNGEEYKENIVKIISKLEEIKK